MKRQRHQEIRQAMKDLLTKGPHTTSEINNYVKVCCPNECDDNVYKTYKGKPTRPMWQHIIACIQQDMRRFDYIARGEDGKWAMLKAFRPNFK